MLELIVQRLFIAISFVNAAIVGIALYIQVAPAKAKKKERTRERDFFLLIQT